MKKWIALVLALVMCMGLCACGNSKYAKYETLIGCLEAGDYESALAELMRLAGEEDGMTIEEQERKAAKEFLTGQWFSLGGVEMVFNDDGTATLDGGTYPWEIYSCRLDEDGAIQSLSLYFGENSENADWFLDVSGTDRGDTFLFCHNDKGGDEYRSYSFYSAEEYELVNITVENWTDYFEIVKTAYVIKNPFDEVECFDVDTKMMVKGELEDKTMSIDVAVEFMGSGEVICPVTYNVETDELTCGEPLTADEIREKDYYISPDSTTQTGEYTYVSEGCYLPSPFWYGDYVDNGDGTHSQYCGFYSLYELQRVAGGLILKK